MVNGFMVYVFNCIRELITSASSKKKKLKIKNFNIIFFGYFFNKNCESLSDKPYTVNKVNFSCFPLNNKFPIFLGLNKLMGKINLSNKFFESKILTPNSLHFS